MFCQWGHSYAPYPQLFTGDKTLDSALYWLETGKEGSLHYILRTCTLCFLCHVMVFTRSSRLTVLITFKWCSFCTMKARFSCILHMHVSRSLRVGWTTQKGQSKQKSKRWSFLLQPKTSCANFSWYPKGTVFALFVFLASEGLPLPSCDTTHIIPWAAFTLLMTPSATLLFCFRWYV